jgi:hypothetical protein
MANVYRRGRAFYVTPPPQLKISLHTQFLSHRTASNMDWLALKVFGGRLNSF